jgi:hypothetical protein
MSEDAPHSSDATLPLCAEQTNAATIAEYERWRQIDEYTEEILVQFDAWLAEELAMERAIREPHQAEK